MSGIVKTERFISVEGNVPEILADVSLIVQSVYESFVDSGIHTEEAKKIIDDAVELGMSTRAEIKQRVKDKFIELIDLLDEGDNDDDETGNTSGENTEDTDR